MRLNANLGEEGAPGGGGDSEGGACPVGGVPHQDAGGSGADLNAVASGAVL